MARYNICVLADDGAMALYSKATDLEVVETWSMAVNIPGLRLFWVYDTEMAPAMRQKVDDDGNPILNEFEEIPGQFEGGWYMQEIRGG